MSNQKSHDVENSDNPLFLEGIEKVDPVELLNRANELIDTRGGEGDVYERLKEVQDVADQIFWESTSGEYADAWASLTTIEAELMTLKEEGNEYG